MLFCSNISTIFVYCILALPLCLKIKFNLLNAAKSIVDLNKCLIFKKNLTKKHIEKKTLPQKQKQVFKRFLLSFLFVIDVYLIYLFYLKFSIYRISYLFWLIYFLFIMKSPFLKFVYTKPNLT